MKTQNRSNEMTLRQAKNALLEMVRHNIKSQYRNSFLGILWTILNPLLNMIVMAIVFSQLLSRNGIDMDYPIYIFCGNIVFNFLRMCTNQCLPCIVANRELLNKTRIPHSIFPLSNALSAAVNFGFSIIAVIAVMLIRLWMGAEVVFSWSMILIIPYFPALFFFSLGIGLILCTVFVRFRDIKHIYGVFLTLWTYLTPLFYSEEVLANKVRAVLVFNPMRYFVKYFREVVGMGNYSDWKTLGICYACAVCSMLLGSLLFHLRKKSFAIYA